MKPNMTLENLMWKKLEFLRGIMNLLTTILKFWIIKNFMIKLHLTSTKILKKWEWLWKKNARINCEPWLAESVGFPFPLGNVSEPFAGHSMHFESPFTADSHADFKLLYIYSDLVEPQIVGDTVAPLLRFAPCERARWWFDSWSIWQTSLQPPHSKEFSNDWNCYKDAYRPINVIRAWEVDRETPVSSKVSLIMLVPYQCCAKSFEDHYTHQSGNGLNYYRGTKLQNVMVSVDCFVRCLEPQYLFLNQELKLCESNCFQRKLLCWMMYHVVKMWKWLPSEDLKKLARL